MMHFLHDWWGWIAGYVVVTGIMLPILGGIGSWRS